MSYSVQCVVLLLELNKSTVNCTLPLVYVRGVCLKCPYHMSTGQAIMREQDRKGKVLQNSPQTSGCSMRILVEL